MYYVFNRRTVLEYVKSAIIERNRTGVLGSARSACQLPCFRSRATISELRISHKT